jgi:N-sulfoglucosamine sulfohydrolase
MKAQFNQFLLLALLTCLASVCVADGVKPNVLWIDIDDQSPWYSAYDEQLIQTPNIDALASEGVVFRRAYAPVPVCAPTRSAMITGTYPIRTGTHDMRSGRTPEFQIHLPPDTKTLPELFREAGYETFAATKDDFNFVYDRNALYSIGNEKAKAVDAKNWKGSMGGGSWRDVTEGRPFYGKIAIAGGKGTRDINAHLKSLGLEPVRPANVRVPAQYPDLPQVRKHIATHYNTILMTDHALGEVMAQLKKDGLWGNTIIFLYSDHGSDLPRSKEFVYHEGLQVPFIVAAPGLTTAMRPGSQRNDIVSLMDIAATSLALAGLPVPGYMDSRNTFDPDYSREYVFSSADRMSNVIDRVRSVMGTEFHYIRNFLTDRPLMNWGHREMIALAAPEKSSFLTIRKLAEAGKLTPAQAAPYGPRIAEELYHLPSDPDEVVNLASDPHYSGQLAEMRAALAAWIVDTGDKGQYPRSKAAMKEITDRYPLGWLRSPEFQNLQVKADTAAPEKGK